jgi:hypothetical protein
VFEIECPKRQSAGDAGPLPRCTLSGLRDQHAPSGPQGPQRKSTFGPSDSKGCIGMQWDENGPAP